MRVVYGNHKKFGVDLAPYKAKNFLNPPRIVVVKKVWKTNGYGGARPAMGG